MKSQLEMKKPPGALLPPEPPKPKPKPKHNARIDEEHVHDPVKCGGALQCRECRGCGLGCKCPHCDPHSSGCECGRSTCPPVQRSAPSQQVGRPDQEPQNKRESSSDGPDDEMAPMMKMFSSVAGKMSNSKGGGQVQGNSFNAFAALLANQSQQNTNAFLAFLASS
eukprot:g36545.t1